MRAAVLREQKKPLSIEEIVLAGPGVGEVLVKVKAVGICHSDFHPIKGDMPVPLPIILGHEGAGIVEDTGPGVTRVKKGDHIVMAVLPSCGKCTPCIIGRPYNCETVWPIMFNGTMLDGTRRLKDKDGNEINHFFCQSSFAEYCVISEGSAVKIDPDISLDKVAVLGCGATTGIGAVLNTAGVEAGAKVAIFGCGGVGLSSVMAAKLAGASKIIAIDIRDNKLEMAKDFGATHTINSAQENPVEKIQELTAGGGADYSFEAIGNADIITQAFDATRPGGMTIIVGAPPVGARVNIDPWAFLMEKVLTGSAAGSLRAQVDIPRYIELFKAGKLPLDKLVSKTFPLDRVNEAFEAMEKGEVARGILIL
jgi:NDMA-dependent alcohol dehydrogenase